MSKENKLLVLFPDRIEDINKKGNLDTILDLINPNLFFERVFISYFSDTSQLTLLRNNIFSFSLRKSKSNFLKNFTFFLDYFRAVVVLTRLIRKEKITIIRSFSPLLEGALGIVLQMITKTPCVVSVHRDIDFDYENIYKGLPTKRKWKILTIIKKFSLRKATRIFVVSNYIKNVVIKNRVSIDKIRVAYHGVKKDIFLRDTYPSIRQELGIDNCPLILFVKRLAKENYVEDVLLAMPGVLKEFPQSHCFILGEGPEERNLKILAQKLNIADKIRFLGFKTSQEVALYMSNADVNICTFAGFTLIEAAASGKPVVAYDVEWHSELIEHQGNGLLVKFRDVEGLTDAVVFLLKNPEIGKKYGDRAKEIVSKKYSFEESANRLVQFYKEIV